MRNAGEDGANGRAARRWLKAHSALVSAALMGGLAFPAAADPTGGVVISGDASISQSGSLTTVTQTTEGAVITWDDFSVGTGEAVHFDQPGVSSATMNRVLGNLQSEIVGEITADGSVFIENRNGVVFGGGASINVGGSFLATTAPMEVFDVEGGTYSFNGAPAGSAIVNEGRISAGSVALVAPVVDNSGFIEANGGDVFLGAATGFTVDFVGDGLLTYEVSADSETSLANSGFISAGGGAVFMTSGAAGDAVAGVVSIGGAVEATRIDERGGVIVLSGGEEGRVDVTGELTAWTPEGDGGSITVTGLNVVLGDGAVLDASGSGEAGDGGTVHLGGEYQGGGETRTARATHVDAGASIRADGSGTGSGGEVIVWADGATAFLGSISVTGGEFGGDGGFVEVSGANFLHLGEDISIDTSAPFGELGEILFDPLTITIGGAGTDDAQITTDNTIAAGDGGAAGAFAISSAALAGLTGTVTMATNDEPGNGIDFVGAVSNTQTTGGGTDFIFTVGENGTITIGADFLTLGDVTFDASATGGSIVQTGVVDVTAANVTFLSGSAFAIGNVGANVALRPTSLTVGLDGALTQALLTDLDVDSVSVNVTGGGAHDISLPRTNSFTAFTSSGDVGAIGLVTSGALALGAVTGDSLSFSAGGAVTQTGALALGAGDLAITITGGAQNITLDNAANTFGELDVVNGGAIIVTDSATLTSGTIGGSSFTGTAADFDLSGGAITVAGTARFDAIGTQSMRIGAGGGAGIDFTDAELETVDAATFDFRTSTGIIETFTHDFTTAGRTAAALALRSTTGLIDITGDLSGITTFSVIGPDVDISGGTVAATGQALFQNSAGDGMTIGIADDTGAGAAASFETNLLGISAASLLFDGGGGAITFSDFATTLPTFAVLGSVIFSGDNSFTTFTTTAVTSIDDGAAGTVTVSGLADLDSIGAITLDNDGNSFGSVDVTGVTGAAISLRDTGALEIVGIAGTPTTVTVQAGGDITDSGTIEGGSASTEFITTANITLDNGFSGNGGNVLISGARPTTIATVTLTDGNTEFGGATASSLELIGPATIAGADTGVDFTGGGTYNIGTLTLDSSGERLSLGGFFVGEFSLEPGDVAALDGGVSILRLISDGADIQVFDMPSGMTLLRADATLAGASNDGDVRFGGAEDVVNLIAIGDSIGEATPASMTISGTATLTATGETGLGGSGDIDLATFSQPYDFRTVVLSAPGDISLNDVGGLTINGTSDGAGGAATSLTVDSDGVINFTGANDVGAMTLLDFTGVTQGAGSTVSVTGLTRLHSFGGTVTLDQAGNDFDTVTERFTNSTFGQITLTDTDGITLGALEATGIAVTATDVTITGGLLLGAGTAAFTNSADDAVNLGAAVDDVDEATFELTDAEIALITAGTLSTTTTGATTVSSVTFANTLGLSSGAVDFDTGLTSLGGLDITASTGVTDTGLGSLAVTGTASIVSSGSAVLDNAANDFGTVTSTGVGQLTLVDVDGVTLGPITATGIDVTATDVDIAAATSAGAGTIAFTNSAGDLIGIGVAGDANEATFELTDADLLLLTAGTLSIDTDGGDLTFDSAALGGIASVTVDLQDTPVTSTAALAFAGASSFADLTVTSSSGVTQTGPLSVTGTADITSAGAIVLANAGNDFGIFTGSGGAVTLTDLDGITLGALTATALTVTATDVDVTGAVNVGVGTVDLTNSAGDALGIGTAADADEATFELSDADIANITAGVLATTTTGATTVQSATFANELRIATAGLNFSGGTTSLGALTVTGSTGVTQDGGSSVEVTGATSVTSTGDIVLASAGNDFTTFAVPTAGQVTLTDSDGISLGPITATGLAVTATDVDITAAIAVGAGIAAFTNGAGDAVGLGSDELIPSEATFELTDAELAFITAAQISSTTTAGTTTVESVTFANELRLTGAAINFAGGPSALGSLTIAGSTGVTQDAGATVAVTGVTAITSSGNVVLAEAANNFASLNGTADAFTITDTGGIIVTSLDATSGGIDIDVINGTTAGTLNATGALTATGAVDLTASAGVILSGGSGASLTVTSTDAEFTTAVFTVGGGTGTASFVNTQNDGIRIGGAGDADLTTYEVSAAELAFLQAGTISTSDTFSTTIDGLTIGTLNIAGGPGGVVFSGGASNLGTLNISSSGGVTQTAPVAVTGTADITSAGAVVLTNAGNDFGTITGTAGSFAIADLGGITLGALAATTGGISVNSTGVIAVTADLSVPGGIDLTSTGGAINFAGRSLTADNDGNGDLLALNALGDLAGVGSTLSGGTITADGLGISIGTATSTVGGIRLSSTGGTGVAVTGPLMAAGVVDVDAVGGAVTLAGITGGSIDIDTVGAPVTLGGLATSTVGGIDVMSATGAIGTGQLTSATTVVLASGGSSVTVGGAIDASGRDAISRNSVDIDAGTFVALQGVTAAGDLDVDAGTRIGLTQDLTITGGSIELTAGDSFGTPAGPRELPWGLTLTAIPTVPISGVDIGSEGNVLFDIGTGFSVTRPVGTLVPALRVVLRDNRADPNGPPVPPFGEFRIVQDMGVTAIGTPLFVDAADDVGFNPFTFRSDLIDGSELFRVEGHFGLLSLLPQSPDSPSFHVQNTSPSPSTGQGTLIAGEGRLGGAFTGISLFGSVNGADSTVAAINGFRQIQEVQGGLPQFIPISNATANGCVILQLASCQPFGLLVPILEIEDGDLLTIRFVDPEEEEDESFTNRGDEEEWN